MSQPVGDPGPDRAPSEPSVLDTPLGRGDSAYERDPGLAAERTELAWSRSTLALMACAAAMAKGLPKVTGSEAHPLAGVIILLIGGLIWLAGLPYAHARSKASHLGIRHVATARELAPLAFGTAAVGLAAVMVDVFLPR